MKTRRTLQNVGLVIAAILVALVVVEVTLRAVYGDKFAPRPGFYMADDVLGWRPAPNLNHTFYGPDFRIKVKTDADGYRLGSLGEIDYGKELVVLIGDSNVFSWGVSTNETFASHLDQRVFEASGGGYRVVNLGVGGYGTFQSVFRFKDFLEKHKDARIAALVFVHSKNDPPDNLNSLGYQLGIWRVKNREPKERSRFHIVNCFAYAGEILKNRKIAKSRIPDDIDKIHPYLQDMLFAHQLDSPKRFPPEIDFGGTVVRFVGISAEDWSAERTLRRENLTDLQRSLLREAIRSLYKVSRNRVEHVFHIIIPNAPDWIEREIGTAIKSTPSPPGIDIEVLGRFPSINGSEKDILNAHSGRHYTPEFNEYWAEAVMDVFVRKGIVVRTNRSELPK